MLTETSRAPQPGTNPQLTHSIDATRGKDVFGNDGCNRDQPTARAGMSAGDRDTVDALQARERAMGCS